MIDHVTLRVRDLAAAKAFYAAALAPLGYQVGKEFPEAIGLGVGGMLDFWLVGDAEAKPQHLAFSAPNRAGVDAFHTAALSAGGADNGPPGLRLDYHPNYYAAFAFDPSGHNIEVVCHRAPGAAKPVAKGRKAVARRSPAKKLAKGRKGASRLARKPTAKKKAKGRK
jgi:catechol 2,3-dioxygenase-like lactoylglutathione lyase family enzyme